MNMRLVPSPKVIVHLTASPFFGGPERQMLGLAMNLPEAYESVFVSFAERGLARPFLEQVKENGFEAGTLVHNTPHFLAAAREVARCLRDYHADILCCHGYKADLLGWLAARHVGIPVIAVSRGWTGATGKVRFYETLDRLILQWMDCTVCVSAGQAAKVRRAGVKKDRVVVIRNAIQTERFDRMEPACRDVLYGLFPDRPGKIVCAVGRLSPEKGFADMVEAAHLVRENDPAVGFVLFGDGPLHDALAHQIEAKGLKEHFILAGFRHDVDRLIPHADLLALSSYTEGLPNVVLEAFAASVPVVATAVGGTPEVIEDGVSGYLVPPGDAGGMARRILDVLRSDEQRKAMGQRARKRVEDHFTFEAQGEQYQRIFERLMVRRRDRRMGGQQIADLQGGAV